MTKRTSKQPNTRMAIWASRGSYNRKENPALALPALPPLEPSPWDDEPFRPATLRKPEKIKLVQPCAPKRI